MSQRHAFAVRAASVPEIPEKGRNDPATPQRSAGVQTLRNNAAVRIQSAARTFQPDQRAFKRCAPLCNASGEPSGSTAADSGPLGEPTPADITAVVDEIWQNGYCVAPRRVPGELLNSLEQFAKVTPAKLRTPKDGHAGPCVYDAQHPVAASYRFTEGQLVNNAAVQALMADAYLLAVAQEYLECIPIFDIVAMWWNVRSDATQADLEELAQLYHFDMDRIKWLKVMIYVTDVDTASGPHCFIKGSHRSGSQPLAIRKRGYVRITDEELAQYFDEDSFREIVGSRGTIIFVDTRGYHKGKPPISNDRLLLEFSLCDSMFGGAFQAPKMAIKNENLKQMAAQVPHIYSRLDIA